MQPPTVSSRDSIRALLARSGRSEVPIRRAFVQQGSRGKPQPGPLAQIVHSHDDRGLELYLLCLAGASKEPWDVRLGAKVWARMLDLETSGSAVSAISKVWRRLEDRTLIDRTRVKRQARILLLREDGSGEAYSHPGKDQRGDAYFKLPHAFWTAEQAWHRTLTLPEIALLLIGLSLSDDFRLPYEQVPRWYGISASSAERGLAGLQEKGLVKVRKAYRSAPLTPVGYTEERHYTLQPPFGPRGRRRMDTSGTDA